MGYFLFDDLVIGVRLSGSATRNSIPNIGGSTTGSITDTSSTGGSSSSNSIFSSSSFGLSPTVRYYFADVDKIKLYASIDAGVRASGSKTRGVKRSQNGFNSGQAIGAAYFLHKTVGLEAELRHSYTKFSQSFGTSTVGIYVGFQIYLGPLN